MLQIARLSPKQLGDSAPLVEAFLRSQLDPSGGFRDRAGTPDLYYSVFGLEGLIALGAVVPAETEGFLRGYGNGEELDLIHLCCLIRCWADVCGPRALPLDAAAITKRLESYRTPEGGYNTVAGSDGGTAYACFMVAAAYQDLREAMPEPEEMLRCLALLRADDGGYANQPDQMLGLTPSTAAAATILRLLGEPYPDGLGEWLLARCHKDGGFYAVPAAPIPDLLSTATALQALAGMKVSISEVQEVCLDFVDSLWTNKGAFYGNWMDDAADCEYTYYGLLALGHLSL
jgi:prenyltransferase beta subunit